MARFCIDPFVAFRVSDVLRTMGTIAPPVRRLTAESVARAAGIDDVATVQNALLDAASDGLLTVDLVDRCRVCGAVNAAVLCCPRVVNALVIRYRITELLRRSARAAALAQGTIVPARREPPRRAELPTGERPGLP